MAKSKNTEETLNELEKLFGKGVVITASHDGIEEVKERIKSGSFTLDLATEGGFPKKGKATCIIGPESVGKSTAAYNAIANEQKNGNLACLLDIEDSIDKDYLKKLDVDLSKLHIISRKALLTSLGVKGRTAVAAEEWFDLTVKILESNIYGIVVLDSIPAMQPMSEIENGVSYGKIASIAAPMTKAYRAIQNALAVSNSAFIYISQWRMSPGKYGDPRIQPGAEAWKYLESLKLELSKSLDKDEDGVNGIIVKGKVTKSKVCQPYKTFEYMIRFGEGIVQAYEIMNLAVEKEIFIKAGNTYYYNETKLGVGLGQVQKFLEDNPEMCEVVKEKLSGMDNLLPIETPEQTEE